MSKKSKQLRGENYLFFGMIWPFFVLAVFIFIHVHITDLPDYSFWLLCIPIMVLGLIAIAYGLFLLLPKNWSVRLRWILTIVLIPVVALLLYLLIVPFFFLFHFAIGGQC